MSQFSNNPGNFENSEYWKHLFFSNPKYFETGNVHWIPDGPLGRSRRASSKDLINLKEASNRDAENFVHLLHSYAIAHNPKAEPIDMGLLPLPLGVDSPNLLALGRSGSGKTQKIMLPAARHAFQCGWSIVYVNVKGVKQTRLLRGMARKYRRRAQTIAATKNNRGIACTLLEGCSNLGRAKEVTEVLVATAARRSRNGEGAWTYNQADEWLQHSIVAICNDNPKSRRNLTEIRRVVQSASYMEFAKEHQNFPVLMRFARYLADGNRNAETITATIAECTAMIDDIEEFLSVSRDEFSFESFAENGGALIIEIDQADVRRLRPFVTLFLTRLKSALQRKANASPTGKLSNKTVIIIDELMASGPIPGLAEDLHTCRELNYSFIAGAQSIAQLSSIYGEDAQVVLDGFQTQLAIAGGLDYMTAEYLSRRTGQATIALPGVSEPSDQDGDLAVNRHWTLSSRPVFLPSEIASPCEHPQLGMPATIISGTGKTPAFQAYLQAIYQDGGMEKLLEEVDTTEDDDLRRVPLKKCKTDRKSLLSKSQPSESPPPGITNTAGWSADQISAKLEQVKQAIKWGSTDGSAKKWWIDFEDDNKNHVPLVLRLAEELAIRNATITDFFLAYVYSGTDSIKANLHYLDYKLLKEKEAAKRKADQASLAEKKADNPKDESDFDIFADVATAKTCKSENQLGELAFMHCTSCRCLIPSRSNRCRVCGISMK